ncbi:MAG: DUF3332 domain-containing protein [bacterium]|nr:DUF3332 domain-containing protein [bacterium]
MQLFAHAKRWIGTLLIATFMIPALPNCFGGFVLTGKWHGFISGISNKWLRWIVFFVTSFVYGIAIFVDAILFNSIEFWSGSNPMSMSDFDERGEHAKTLESGDEKVVFTYRNYGEDLRIDMWKQGEYKGNMVLLRSEPGQFYTEKDGELSPIQVSDEQLEDGRLVTVRAGELQVKRKLGLLEYYALREKSERALRGPNTFETAPGLLIADEKSALPAGTL